MSEAFCWEHLEHLEHLGYLEHLEHLERLECLERFDLYMLFAEALSCLNKLAFRIMSSMNFLLCYIDPFVSSLVLMSYLNKFQ